MKSLKKSILIFLLVVFNLNAGNCQLDWAVTTGPSTFFSTDIFTSAMVVDGYGNSYSCGSFYNTIDFDPGPAVNNHTSINNWDIFVRKLNVDGQLEWIATMGGSNEDKALGISIDVNGNLIITGWFKDSADFDPGIDTSYLYAPPFTSNGFAVKLDTDGNYIWSKSFVSNVYSRTKTSTSNLNSDHFIIGEFSESVDLNPGLSENLSPGNNGGIFVTKLDENGNYIWGGAFNGAGWNESYDVKISVDGSCIITGHFEELTDFNPGPGVQNITSSSLKDIFILSLNSAGQLNWVNTYGGNWNDMPSRIATTEDGKIYLTGSFSSSINFNPTGSPSILNSTSNTYNTFILKLSNSGTYEWVKSIEGFLNESRELIVDQNGNIVIGGDYWMNADFNPGAGVNELNAAGQYEIYLFGLDPLGNYIWSKNFPTSNQSRLSGLGKDLLGNFYLSGSYFDTIDFDPGPGTYESIALAQPWSFNLKLSSTLSLDENKESDFFEIYPNPTSDYLNVNSKFGCTFSLDIYNLMGDEIISSKETNKIDVSKLPSGTYFILINKNQRKLFIKQ